MNIENLIDSHKCSKFGFPESACIIGDINVNTLNEVKDNILGTYDLASEDYATEELVFYKTRRIVAKTSHIRTEKQLYTSIDFDNKLIGLVQPIIKEVQRVLGDVDPSLVQIATILPGQKLAWHVDTFLYQQFSNKIHIPLVSNDCAFYDVLVKGKIKRTNMSVGHIWNINNLDLHRSINLGDTFRSHLIIDFVNRSTLEILNSTGINYFHHRLEHMSEREALQIEELNRYASLLLKSRNLSTKSVF